MVYDYVVSSLLVSYSPSFYCWVLMMMMMMLNMGVSRVSLLVLGIVAGMVVDVESGG